MERRKGKKKLKSKTLWLNTLFAMGTVAEANIGLLQSQFGPKVYLGLLMLLAGINYVLRFVTSQPVE